jgi:ureidoacrylate peracid hydrolase
MGGICFVTMTRTEKNRILTFDERVDPTSTALVVVDVQNDFALPQGVCGQVGDDISPVAPMLERLKDLIESARQAGVLIVFLRTIYDEVVLSPALAEQYQRRGYPNSICLTGSRGAEFYEGIGPRDAPNEILVTKHRYSAFWGSSIDLVLRANGIRTLILTGTATEVCVESTARDAFFKDYQVVVPEDCVGCYSEDRQKAALVVIARSFGVVTASNEIRSVWQRLGNGPRNWHPASRRSRALTSLANRLRPFHTALILINVQKDFFERDGALDRKGKLSESLTLALPCISRLMMAARQVGCLIIHAKTVWDEALRYEGVAPESTLSRLCAAGTAGADFVNGLGPIDQEQVVTCHRFSAFADTQLEVLLRSNGIRTVVVAGATTNCAVESTVRDAAARDYHSIVAEDCVAMDGSESARHAASLATMSQHFGSVISSVEIASHWQGTRSVTELAGAS